METGDCSFPVGFFMILHAETYGRLAMKKLYAIYEPHHQWMEKRKDPQYAHVTGAICADRRCCPG